MNQKKNALVFVNVGTPDKPKVKHVRRYLFQFLNDMRVIDLPWLLQKFLVNVIIVPFRARNSTKLYKILWTDKGSPLLIYLNSLADKVQKQMMGKYDVYGAMRYGNPALKKILRDIQKKDCDSVTIFSLYPHYASSTTGSVSEFVMKEMKNWEVIPEVKFIDQFYDHPAFIGAFVQTIKSYNPENYDHVIFSYHGLPNRQIDKVHPEIKSTECNCTAAMPAHGKHCYKATCYETSRLLAKGLGLKEGSYTTSFQSRLSNNWLTPFTDRTLEKLAADGVKKVLIAAPAFVADCLETTVELGHEYKEMFTEKGGEELTMVESLNDRDVWVEAILEILGTEWKK